MDPQDFRNYIEEKVLDVIENGLETETISLERAQQLSDLVLNSLKEDLNVDQLYVTIQQLKYKAPERSTIILEILDYYDEQKKGSF